MKRKIFLFMGIVVAACIIWIGCDGSMPEMYKIKGGDVAYYIGDSTGFGFEGPTNEDDTFSFWFMVRESMWESTLRSDCQEVGCYVFVNDIAGALFEGKKFYGSPNSGSIYPGSSDPASNGLAGPLTAVAYIHTHPSSSCIEEGYMRYVGPSDADQDWAERNGMPLYTIDYTGTVDPSSGDYYINSHTNYSSSYQWYTSNPY